MSPYSFQELENLVKVTEERAELCPIVHYAWLSEVGAELRGLDGADQL